MSSTTMLLAALPPLTLLNSAIALVTIVAGGLFYQIVWKHYRLPYKNVPGPWSWNPIMGSMNAVFKAEPGVIHKGWIETYGHSLYYTGFLFEPRFYTTDAVALQYILSHADDFPKSDRMRKSLAEILGEGVLFAEGADHRRQRKIMNPSFAPSQIRDNHMPIFLSKAYELRDVFSAMLKEDNTDATAAKRIDVYKWLGKCTLDVIGLAGFDYDFSSLSTPDNELANAFAKMFSKSTSITPFVILQSLLPLLDKIPTERGRAVKESLATTRRIGKELIAQKKKAVQESAGADAEKGGHVGRDLLSVCVRANMAPDLKESQRMTDEELLGQITTFMLAGQETSSTALNWALYMLSLHHDVQDKLREELLAVAEEMPSMDDLNNLPYLDAFTHEVLRLLSPVPNSRRDSAVDAVIPLGKPLTGRNGKIMNSVFLPKGTPLILPILGMNTAEEIWGSDAWEFKPSRWLKNEGDEKPYKESPPGVWGHMMTFLGGPRACIGYRFAVLEIKAILFVLVRSFIFEAVQPTLIFEKKTSLVTRPVVISEKEKGPQMPLMVRAVA